MEESTEELIQQQEGQVSKSDIEDAFKEVVDEQIEEVEEAAEAEESAAPEEPDKEKG